MNKRVRGWLCIAMGIVMLCAAGGLYLRNEQQDKLAGETSALLLEMMQEEIMHNQEQPAVPEESSEPIPEPTPEPAPSAEPIPELPLEDVSDEEPPPPVMELSGYSLLGILTAPSVEVELPILDDWNYTLLQVAPCRYSGSIAEGNLILLGHNFKSHFDSLQNIAVDDPVEFISTDGTLHRYTVAEIELLHKYDVDKLERDEYALTFFTCTKGGEHRLVIRCVPDTSEN